MRTSIRYQNRILSRLFVSVLTYSIPWKLMKDMVVEGEELMPHRMPANSEPASQEEPASYVSQTGPTTPIRKLSRNRGWMVLEEAIVEDSPEHDIDRAAEGMFRRSKCML